eukprot:TRINITY_DN26389_c0_g2_i1.p1 TRINITY_DN26389_c0_g2~~TRINITY_DN26389_c0_g2_i1.p1  ORF type:complete len:305 (+),score=23.14 TRINITY_DN26389_c0_g2_i1:43-957(+)
MIRCLIALSVLTSVIALALPLLNLVLTHAITDDRSAWYLGTSDTAKPYVCKKSQSGSCEASWRSFQGRCYIAVGRSRSRSRAKQSCENMNGSLVSIHSEAENAHVSSLCMELAEFEDGADQDGRPACFIGLSQTAAGREDWSWDDGSNVSYTNWGRARGLVGSHEAVTVNGNWILAGGVLDMVSLGVNVILMCGSTASLIFAACFRYSSLYKWALKADAVGSLLCIATLILWVPGRSEKDPARNIPLIILCGLQELSTLLFLIVQVCSSGFEPQWLVTSPPVASRVQAASALVQPQTVPPPGDA